MTVRFKPQFSCLSSDADSWSLNISVSTQILNAIKFVDNVHEIGGVFDNLPTPDKVVPIRTNLFLPFPKRKRV